MLCAYNGDFVLIVEKDGHEEECISSIKSNSQQRIIARQVEKWETERMFVEYIHIDDFDVDGKQFED